VKACQFNVGGPLSFILDFARFSGKIAALEGDESDGGPAKFVRPTRLGRPMCRQGKCRSWRLPYGKGWTAKCDQSVRNVAPCRLLSLPVAPKSLKVSISALKGVSVEKAQ